MKNIEFYIFRHGQTDWNKKKRIQGSTDIPLNELGRKEAQSLKDFFSAIEVDHVFTSDLSRAYETAKIVFEDRSISITKSPELREANFGEVEGMYVDELLSRFSTKFWDIHKGGTESDKFAYPGGENRGEVRSRLISFIDKIRKEKPNSTIALSTHGGALRSIMHHYLPNEKELVKIPNCVVYKIIFCGDEFTVEGPYNNEKDLCYS